MMEWQKQFRLGRSTSCQNPLLDIWPRKMSFCLKPHYSRDQSFNPSILCKFKVYSEFSGFTSFLPPPKGKSAPLHWLCVWMSVCMEPCIGLASHPRCFPIAHPVFPVGSVSTATQMRINQLMKMSEWMIYIMLLPCQAQNPHFIGLFFG